MTDLNRLKALAGLNEDADEESYDHDADARLDRQKHVETLIRHAFSKLGLDIADSNIGVMYDETTREAEVLLDDVATSLTSLAGLLGSGLGTDYKVRANADMNIEVSFKVDPALDNATIA